MKTTLYRYYDSEGQLLYVGITGNNTKRQSQHRRNSFWFGEVATASFEYFDDREEALEAETKAIQNEKPKHNIKKHGITFQHSPYVHMIYLAGMPDEGHDQLHKDFARKYREIFDATDGHVPKADMVIALAMQFAKVDIPDAPNLTKCNLCIDAFDSEWFDKAFKALKRSWK